ncbi:hypothetical protein [Thalassotalea marina]|uniref:Uncharacterized protein n=1 Tax=Thalassotalea marina TaxID=1673741 RepID=A0A919BPI4_9GAMM|nr:hypothetical protein [Thalassotalea marina]GHG03401.1 hypothetical protein GCM10017161_35840 [Thalassotalea marina]
MASSYSAYRKDRYYHGSSKRKGNIYFMVSLTLLLITIAASGFLIHSQKKSHDSAVEAQEKKIEAFETELSWLRAINPYQGSYEKIEELAVKNNNLFPGWVTRVYPVPEHPNLMQLEQDVGTFVLNETKFSLASHKRYGITEQNKSMYLLNGLLPSMKKGRHQIAVKFTVSKHADIKNERGVRKMGSCYSKFYVNQKRVIDKRINLVGDDNGDALHIGEVNLELGVYPVSGMIYCDKKSDYNDDEIDISIMFREPSEQVLSASRYNVFHVYKPDRRVNSL